MNFRRILRRPRGKLTEPQTPDQFRQPDMMANTYTVDHVHVIMQQSMAGDNAAMMTLYRDLIGSDSHLQAELSKRKLAVLGDEFNVSPWEQTDTVPATLVENAVKDATDWTDGLAHLMDSCLWPVAVAEKIYKPSSKPGLRFELDRLIPVDHQLIEFANNRPYLREINDMGHWTGSLVEIDPDRYIIHKGHLLTTPNAFGGPFRSIVFWCLFTAFDRDWWVRFLDRFGAPFLIGKYDQSDDASRRILQRAFSAATKLYGLVISKQTEVEIQHAATASSGDAYAAFLQVCQNEKSKFVLGQTLSSSATATGMGSGVADLQGDVRNDIQAFDSARLGETIRNQLFSQILRINGITGSVPVAKWGGEDIEEVKGEIFANLYSAGITPTDDGIQIIGDRLGIPLQRVIQPSFGGFATPFSANVKSHAILGQDATLRAVSDASAEHLRERRERSAEAARIIRDSESADDAVAALSEVFNIPSADAVLLAETLLTTAIFNGIESA